MRQCLGDQSLFRTKKIQEHSEAGINGRCQWPQRKTGKAIAQDIVSDFVEQLCSAIEHWTLYHLETIVSYIERRGVWYTDKVVVGQR